MTLAARILIVLASLSGLLGVGLSAAAAHVTGGSLTTAAQFLLFHAPALLALAALIAAGAVHPLLAQIAGYVIVLGLALFCGDLSRRAFSGMALFPRAAPTGGILLMIGWVMIGVSSLLNR
ncbi:uncharacterized membrane protein YgdD (TMEM256/DUF423 family) [Microvirga flocculans]|uniref:Uncharacterized membrane protein YgdD (TMEM256/DUF423 family) n=1 Tax=Microvirga flocculans TaxID=217168 RepID=A0A7W6ID60_9HYPH|nr:DUF423 domain-containing protein [Microvirga flocculans]MBB4038951.1 uncharacterized membrane protein YgdD (TMEM256/DUF423 family) [Microvirga flocculans]